MKSFRITNLIFIGLIFFVSLAGDKQQAEAIKLELLILIPAILLKLGLAAPIVLALFAKLLLILGIKKAVLLASLLGNKDSGSHEFDLTKSFSIGGGSDHDHGRIKRSVDFVQEIVGKENFSEEKLLETVFSLDTRKCGEKLLCEVAASVKAQTAAKRVVDEEEAAIVTLFGQKRSVEGPAQKAYKEAVIGGLKKPNCASRYPSCPFDKTMMMRLVSLVTESQPAQLPSKLTEEVVRSPSLSKKKKSSRQQSPFFRRQQNEREIRIVI